MSTIKRTLCGLAVKELASASVCHAIDTVATDVIVETEILKGATKTVKYAVKGASIGVGMLAGNFVVGKLIDGAVGNDKHYKKGKKHHHKKKYHKNEHDTKKKKLEVKGLPEKEETKETKPEKEETKE